MAHRGSLLSSPRRHGPGAIAPFRPEISGLDAGHFLDVENPGAAHSSNRAHARASLGYLFLAALEGLLSLAALRSAWSAAAPIAAAAAVRTSAFSAAWSAARSGAALAVGTPFFLLAARCAVLALGRLVRSLDLRQPRLGFALPGVVDEHAALDLYVIGLSAGILGVCVPMLEVLGTLLGMMLDGSSVVWSISALLCLAPGLYAALGALLRASAPAEGFTANTRPTRAMWGLCAIGQLALLMGCFYSPDVTRESGFLLGLVHIVRLLQQAFLVPPGVGTWVELCGEEGALEAAEL